MYDWTRTSTTFEILRECFDGGWVVGGYCITMMNLKRKQKKCRRNQSGQRQRHKAVSAGCQFWFKPAPSKARSFASVLARVVPTPALAPLDKKHQRSSGCGLPYHLKQRQLGYWTVPGTTLLGAICFYLATKSWKHPPKKTGDKVNLASFISSRSCLTRSNLGRGTVPCQTVSNQFDGPVNVCTPFKCQCDASHGSMMTDVGHEGLLGSTYSILPFNLISFSALGLVWKFVTEGIVSRCKVNPLWSTLAEQWIPLDLAPGSTWHDDVCGPCGPSSSSSCCCSCC